MPEFYRIAVATPLRRTFVYLPAEQEDAPVTPVGCRVIVPFGRQKLIGLVTGLENKPPADIEVKKLRPLHKWLDSKPVVSEAMLGLYLWAARYYQAPPGEAIFLALPAQARQLKPIQRKMTRFWCITQAGEATDPGSMTQSKKRAALLEKLQQSKRISHSDLLNSGYTLKQCQALESSELIAEQWVSGFSALVDAHSEPAALTPDQQSVVSGISRHLNKFSTHLIEGVTGSGKTEVYLALIRQMLKKNKQTLILVPEIGLTPQTYQRIQSCLDTPVGVLHSGLSDRERTDTWLDMAEGRLRVLLGTRSAIFVPMAEPGLIILDEEHDNSYKQQDGFRYHARDLAIKRSSLDNIPVIFGSATPSLESLHKISTERTHLWKLTRPAVAQNPAVAELIDLSKCNHQFGISAPLVNAIQSELAENRQVLLFLNRRGFAPTLMCQQCGWVAGCPNCDARLTLHLSPDYLLCHHCQHKSQMPNHCPSCRSPAIEALGQGTARIQSYLSQVIPGYPVIRIDRDTVTSNSAFEQHLQPVRNNQPCILLGTQMLAKGHDFPLVSLAAVLDADAGLFASDFRAAEKTAQLLTQVAGRAGRAQIKGRVMIQTWHPQHPVFEYLQFGGYGAYARDHLLPQRKEAGLPPYTAMAMIRADAKDELKAIDFLKQVAFWVPDTLLSQGPFPAVLSRRSGMHRQWLALYSSDKKHLLRVLDWLAQEIDKGKLPSQVSWGIDVDPVDTV